MTLKPLRDQTLVVTGASSGIGLVTARKAAGRGARVVLAARSGDALRQLADEITGAGGQAVAVVADVADRDDVGAITEAAQDAFGGFDTWVNNAGRVPLRPARRDAGRGHAPAVRGQRVGLGLRLARSGPAPPVEGRRAPSTSGACSRTARILFQGIYSASKHAVKGFTDALRMELEKEGAPVSVTLIKPNAVDTPYPAHAKNYLDAQASVPPPVYAPDVVARPSCTAPSTRAAT